MNAGQVRAKARMAMKRREEEIETEEMEGGELNLVPYLDIVTNLMLFLLATVAAGIVLGNINTSLPEYSDDTAAGGGNDDDEPPLSMMVAITERDLTLFALGLPPDEPGGLNKPFLRLADTDPSAAYRFDFPMLKKTATELVQKRWKGLYPLSLAEDKETPICVDGQKNELDLNKCRPQGATEIIIAAEPTIPYYVIVGVMDSVRENNDVGPDGAPIYKYPDSLMFPDAIFSSGIK